VQATIGEVQFSFSGQRPQFGTFFSLPSIFITPIFSGPYGARTLSRAVETVRCIKIGEAILQKSTWQFSNFY
jgi:hypothetical protein